MMCCLFYNKHISLSGRTVTFSQAAINEANALTKVNAALRQEKEEYVYRSYLGLGQYHVIVGEISDSPNTPVGENRNINNHISPTLTHSIIQ